jgi:hypothetical protein
VESAGMHVFLMIIAKSPLFAGVSVIILESYIRVAKYTLCDIESMFGFGALLGLFSHVFLRAAYTAFKIFAAPLGPA